MSSRTEEIKEKAIKLSFHKYVMRYQTWLLILKSANINILSRNLKIAAAKLCIYTPNIIFLFRYNLICCKLRTIVAIKIFGSRIKQECIPLGCVPGALYCTGVCPVQGGLCLGGLHPGVGSLSRGVSARETPQKEYETRDRDPPGRNMGPETENPRKEHRLWISMRKSIEINTWTVLPGMSRECTLHQAKHNV